MTGQNADVTGGGADDELLYHALEFHAVGGDDLQKEGGHLPSPPLNFSTTSSMEPAYRK